MAGGKCSVKLSTNKKSIFGLRMWSQILCLLVATCFFAAASADNQISCANVRSTFEKKGMLSAVDIQTQPNSGENHALQYLPFVIMINDNVSYLPSSQ